MSVFPQVAFPAPSGENPGPAAWWAMTEATKEPQNGHQMILGALGISHIHEPYTFGIPIYKVLEISLVPHHVATNLFGDDFFRPPQAAAFFVFRTLRQSKE